MGRLRSLGVLVRFFVPVALGCAAACGGEDSRPHNSTNPAGGDGGASGAAGTPLTPPGGAGAGGGSDAGGASGAASVGGMAGTIEAGSSGDAPVAGTAGTAGEGPAPAEQCAINTECSAVDICVRMPGTAVGTCRPRCSPTDVGSQAVCGQGELCAFDTGGSTASCQRICDPLDPDIAQCPSMDGCFVSPSPTLTGEITVPGLCVRVGTLGPGEPCEEGTCGAGFECLATIDGGGIGYCAAWCAPAAPAGAAGACPEGQSCETGTTGRTGCVQRCAALSAGECDENFICRALVGGAGAVEEGGRCVVPGTTDIGAPCEPGDCAEGLLCTGWPTPLAAAERTCSTLCSLSDPSSCFVGTCIPIGTPASDVGTCHETCEPLAAGAAAGCDENAWCAPSTTLVGVGVCIPSSGTVPAGEACRSQAECSAGSYCECRFGADAFCSTEATCEPICIPGSASGEAGACPAEQNCTVKSDAGVRYPFGICRVECDLSTGENSCSGDETCISAILTGSDSDACSDVPLPIPSVGEYCPSPPFNVGEVCGEAALCIQWESLELPRCSESCGFARGAEGTTLHPDCTDPNATCTAIAGESEFGYCRGGGA